jgi:ribokinase
LRITLGFLAVFFEFLMLVIKYFRMAKKIFVLGSINLDLVLYSDKFPNEGETIVGKDFFINLGGKGANQAIAASKAGGATTFIGRVGKDYFGELALNEIKKSDIKTEIIQDTSAHTGIAMINVNVKGENKIVVISGTNGLLGNEEINILKNKICHDDILLLQGEIPTWVLVEAAKYSFGIGASVIFDPSPVRKDLKKVIPFSTFLTPNEIELNELTSNCDIGKLLSLGEVSIILKLGKNGIRYKSKSEDFTVQAFNVNVVDTTGAGDTFNGTFATAISQGKGLKEALIFASAASAISVTRKGAAISSPRREEIENFLKERM